MLNMDHAQSTPRFICEENVERMWQCVYENYGIWSSARALLTPMHPENSICFFSKCVSLFPSARCNGFIPAVAFYQREHQSARVTFNPKPGQVEKHTYMRMAQKNAHKTNRRTHVNTLSGAWNSRTNTNQNQSLNLRTLREHCGSCSAMRECELNCYRKTSSIFKEEK